MRSDLEPKERLTVPFPENLRSWGYDDERHQVFLSTFAAPDVVPGRVVRDHKGFFRVQTIGGELIATLAGRLKHQALSASELPAVGDFVAVRTTPSHGRGVIAGVFPRTTIFKRRAAGEETVDQVVAANIDIVFLVTGLDGDFSMRRLERYLVLARDSGAQSVVLLNKEDVAKDRDEALRTAERVAGGCPVHLIGAKSRTGLDALAVYLTRGTTIAFLGSSGAGKSTLINAFLGEEIQATQSVREFDSKGRHTTTERQMFRLAGGALAIDTPGMRELQLWTADDDLGTSFDEIVSLAHECRFRDCSHAHEPGCAVRQAVLAKGVAEDRYNSYLKLRAELEATHRAKDERSRKKLERLMGRAMNKVQREKK